MNEINVFTEAMLEIAGKIETAALSSPFHANDQRDCLIHSTGAFGETTDIITGTDCAVNSTKQLMGVTADFLKKAATVFKDVDQTIAQEVSES